MPKPDFTPQERDAMRAMRFLIHDWFGGPEHFAAAKDLNPRTANRMASMQQPPPMRLAKELLDEVERHQLADGERHHWDNLAAFAAQRARNQ